MTDQSPKAAAPWFSQYLGQWIVDVQYPPTHSRVHETQSYATQAEAIAAVAQINLGDA
jgi:hypothetical protein